MFGIAEFSAIINPPQCGILAVGGGRSAFSKFYCLFMRTLGKATWGY